MNWNQLDVEDTAQFYFFGGMNKRRGPVSIDQDKVMSETRVYRD